jgi:hypothetical protein
MPLIRLFYLKLKTLSMEKFVCMRKCSFKRGKCIGLHKKEESEKSEREPRTQAKNQPNQWENKEKSDARQGKHAVSASPEKRG